MEHDEAVRLQMTEQYLLDELSPEAREEFEEHYFDCRECAADVGAGATFVTQSRIVLAQTSAHIRKPAPSPWSAWFRPTWAVPVMATLLVLVGYQNLVSLPRLLEAANFPRVLPYATVSVGSYGSEAPVIPARSGEGFVLLLRIPQQDGYASYTANLYDPSQKLEWTVTVPAAAAQDASSRDQWALQVPGARRQSGKYSVVVRAETRSGASEEVGRGSFELQVQ
jgi:Putative zinc-finger